VDEKKGSRGVEGRGGRREGGRREAGKEGYLMRSNGFQTPTKSLISVSVFVNLYSFSIVLNLLTCIRGEEEKRRGGEGRGGWSEKRGTRRNKEE
jgi:hypothetical protein